MSDLTVAERAILLASCECGHDLNDHGSLACCWKCDDDEPPGTCDVHFEELLVRGVEAIVEGRMAVLRDALEDANLTLDNLT